MTTTYDIGNLKTIYSDIPPAQVAADALSFVMEVSSDCMRLNGYYEKGMEEIWKRVQLALTNIKLTEWRVYFPEVAEFEKEIQK